MSLPEIEKQLEALSQSWPGKSVADQVSEVMAQEKADSAAAPLATIGRHEHRGRPWLEIAVTAIVIAALCIALRPATKAPPSKEPSESIVADLDNRDLDNNTVLAEEDLQRDPNEHADLPAADSIVSQEQQPIANTHGMLAQNETGNLKITFKLKGAPKKLPAIGEQTIPDERLIVNEENRGIKNVVVYLHNNRRGTKLDAQPMPKRKLTLTTKGLQFEPHILLAQVGDSLKIKNAGPTGINSNIQFFNIQANFQIPPGKSESIELKMVEPSLMPLSCNIHPWMKTHVLVVDHAFYGLSDQDGVLEIKDIPVGNKVTFKAWHEVGSFRENIVINGKTDAWLRNVFEFEIKAGDNDMGIVEVPAGVFQL